MTGSDAEALSNEALNSQKLQRHLNTKQLGCVEKPKEYLPSKEGQAADTAESHHSQLTLA